MSVGGTLDVAVGGGGVSVTPTIVGVNVGGTITVGVSVGNGGVSVGDPMGVSVGSTIGVSVGGTITVGVSVGSMIGVSVTNGVGDGVEVIAIGVHVGHGVDVAIGIVYGT